MTSFSPVRLAYVTFEPVCGATADLPPVIFLHGTTATKECWGSIPQHIAVKSRRKVYCLDARNHGDSEWSDVFNFDVNIDDLLCFMDSQQIPKAVLIGHSMGGVTCMRTAFKQPDRVEMAFVVDMFVHRVPQRVLDAVVGLVEVFEEAVSSIPPQCSEDEAQRRIKRHAAGSKALTDAIFTIFTKSISQRKSNTVPKWISSRKEDSAHKKPKSNANLPLKRNEDGSYSLKFNSKVIKDNMLSEELIMSEPEGIYEGPTYFLYGTESPYVVYTPVPLSFICVQPDDGKCKDAPPIVFLHGLSVFKSNWGDVPQAVANATKRKAYVIDARNHGDSEWCDQFNFDCNADDLLHFLDYIGANRATLVGHSMGGTTSIKTALRAPERVESIVVEDMSVKRLPQASCDILAKYLRLLSNAVKEVPPDVDESTAKNIIGKIFLDNSPYVKKIDPQDAYQLKRHTDGRYYHSFNAEVLTKAFEQKAEEVMSENTGEYCGPAAFIYGDQSPVQVGNDEEIIKRSFPNAVLMKIEEAGHEIHKDFSTEFKKSLIDFINTI